MKNYFTISELCITSSALPLYVADALLKYHIEPMNRVRHEYGKPVTASAKSGYRPAVYELSKGRDANSQHTFTHTWKKGIGAIDWTGEGDIKRLLELIIMHTDYTRMAYYPDNKFIHCDYKDGDRTVFISDSKSNWYVHEKLKEGQLWLTRQV